MYCIRVVMNISHIWRVVSSWSGTANYLVSDSAVSGFCIDFVDWQKSCHRLSLKSALRGLVVVYWASHYEQYLNLPIVAARTYHSPISNSSGLDLINFIVSSLPTAFVISRLILIGLGNKYRNLIELYQIHNIRRCLFGYHFLFRANLSLWEGHVKSIATQL